jgi:hypothetical protein
MQMGMALQQTERKIGAEANFRFNHQRLRRGRAGNNKWRTRNIICSFQARPRDRLNCYRDTGNLKDWSKKVHYPNSRMPMRRVSMAKRHLKLVSPATVNRTVRPKRPPTETCAHENI